MLVSMPPLNSLSLFFFRLFFSKFFFRALAQAKGERALEPRGHVPHYSRYYYDCY